MATEKITTLKNAAKTTDILPRTKVSAVSDNNGTGLDVLLDNLSTELSNVQTKIDSAVESINVLYWD